MVQFGKPRFQFEERQRALDCRYACTKVYSKLIDEAVAMGWRREEVALQLADAADDYILYLASNLGPELSPSKAKDKVAANDDLRPTASR